MSNPSSSANPRPLRVEGPPESLRAGHERRPGCGPGRPTPIEEAATAAREFFGLPSPQLSPLEGGRVNESFLVDSRGCRFVLQRLNSFFRGDAALGLNWQLVYQAVSERSGQTEPPLPPIFPDLEGRYLASGPQVAGFWRLTGYQTGRPAEKSAGQARLAARLLGFFHRHLNLPAPVELEPLPEGDFTNQRLTRPEDFEDLADQYCGHPHLEEIRPLIETCAEAAWHLPTFPGFVNIFNLRDVIIHGDPKVDNFLVSPGGGSGVLLDWDSVGYGHLLIDLAEMLRSWGWLNPAEASAVNTDNLAAVIEGYSETGLELGPTDLELLPPILRAIALNLGRRYLTDALAEVYFKWDSRHYPSLYQQNQARAESMLNLAAHLLDREFQLIDLLAGSVRA